MAATIGHNSRAVFGEADPIRADLEAEEATPFLYVQWHVNDYIAGTMGMGLELEGAYTRFLIRLYQRGKPFPDDDRLLCMVMGLTIRVWRRLKATLITLGKITVRAGCLTNNRFEKERRKRAETLRKQAEAARKRHAREREERASLAETLPNFAESFAEVLPKLSQNGAEKPNGINGSHVTDRGESYNHITYNQENKSPPIVPQGGTDFQLEQSSEDAPPKPKTKRRQLVPESYPNDFAEFWKLYPRREGKAKAFEYWDRLTLPQKRRAYAALKEQLPVLRVRANDSRGNFCPLPGTWINQGRFDDTLEQKPVRASYANGHYVGELIY